MPVDDIAAALRVRAPGFEELFEIHRWLRRDNFRV
jgi:hypothetical protein